MIETRIEFLRLHYSIFLRLNHKDLLMTYLLIKTFQQFFHLLLFLLAQLPVFIGVIKLQPFFFVCFFLVSVDRFFVCILFGIGRYGACYGGGETCQ